MKGARRANVAGVAALAAAFALSLAGTALAKIDTWKGVGGDTKWSTPDNWLP
ncbi:hypothetical protein FF3_01080 [Fretibacterium fastidiosum]|uniref:Uncharacterized protein n=1 Tax=Fretibacterium fastidiosum TaxID=651822 RepID=A0AB94IYA4_9BACT|nr:hypothetical protein SY1_17860 [Fretibacterium fastidiosum]